jgi:hypothetical protein
MSKRYDATMPTSDAAMPTAHPIARRTPMRLANSVAITAGMTRKVKTNNTPAIETDEVITKANVT